jgi:hypothetical protein
MIAARLPSKNQVAAELFGAPGAQRDIDQQKQRPRRPLIWMMLRQMPRALHGYPAMIVNTI